MSHNWPPETMMTGKFIAQMFVFDHPSVSLGDKLLYEVPYNTCAHFHFLRLRPKTGPPLAYKLDLKFHTIIHLQFFPFFPVETSFLSLRFVFPVENFCLFFLCGFPVKSFCSQFFLRFASRKLFPTVFPGYFRQKTPSCSFHPVAFQ